MDGQPSGGAVPAERYMREALAQARDAAAHGEVPVGAVVVMDGQIVGRGANRTRRDGVVSAHAEIVALSEAEQRLGDYRLDNGELYVTVEPCLMCLGAIHQARIGRLYYGAEEPKFGALAGRFSLSGHPALSRLAVSGGLLAGESARLLSEFFIKLRKTK